MSSFFIKLPVIIKFLNDQVVIVMPLFRWYPVRTSVGTLYDLTTFFVVFFYDRFLISNSSITLNVKF